MCGVLLTPAGPSLGPAGGYRGARQPPISPGSGWIMLVIG
jgi:hypothetical protein